MALSLKSALGELLEGWKADVSGAWRQVIADTELDFEAVDKHLELRAWEPIFPSRRQAPLPGAPQGAHIFHAFDHLHPRDVRCVILGQDPYPSICFSTGRAFEAGGFAQWRELDKMSSHSMRSLIQALHAHRTGAEDSPLKVDDWPQTLEAIERQGPDFPAPAHLAQSWVEQGVLLLNASLTLSRFSVEGHPHQLLGHLPLWRPLMAHLMRYFTTETERQVVCILMGEAAARSVDQAIDKDTGLVVATPHPAAGNEFLSAINPFSRCNELLLATGAEPIQW